jgi:hypothetical protein
MAGAGVSVLVMGCIRVAVLVTPPDDFCCIACTKHDPADNETGPIPSGLIPRRPAATALRLRCGYAYLTNEKKRGRLIAIDDRITTVP